MLSYPDTVSNSLQKIIREDVSSNLQFDIDNAFKDFKSGVSAVIKSNIKLLEEVPLTHRLSREDIKNFLEHKIRKDLYEDPIFEKAIELSRYTRNMLKYMDSYFKEIFTFHEKVKKELYAEIFHVSKMFLNSDLPLSFINVISDSLLAEIDCIDIFDREIKRERLDLIKYRSNVIKFKRVCENHNRWVDAFIKAKARMEKARIKLIWYIDFNNSENVHEIFKDKQIRIKLLDRIVLIKLIDELRKCVHQMEKLNNSKIDINSVFQSYRDYKQKDEGTKTLLRMIQVFSQH